MKRKYIYLMSAVLCMTGLAGCVQTPEDSLVKQKGTASLGNYEEGSSLEEKAGASEDSQGENLLRSVLNAPEHYENVLTDATGKLTINTDADVEIPNAGKISAINVSQHPFDQDQIDLITDVFFQGGKIYDANLMSEMTKADCMEKIQELKGYVAEGNLDPYNAGKTEGGEYQWDIYEAIEAWEQNYEEAPEEVQMVEVTPSIEIKTYGEGDKAYQTDDFSGYVEMPDGTEYTYRLKHYNSMPMEVGIYKTHIDTKTGKKDYQSARPWTEYTMVADTDHTGWNNFPTEEELKENLGITYEEAKSLADEKVTALGFTDMEVNAWDYGIYGAEQSDITDDVVDIDVQDYGYIFHYTRTINEIPITYTLNLGGSYESMDSDMETWSYETLDIVVTKNGIDSVDFYNRYDIGDIKTENLNLLSFDEIIEIYEKMILIENAEVTDYVESETINVDRITFGYTRIYEPASSSTEGVLVPVWDFFGGISLEYKEEDGTIQSSDNCSDNSSHITINAIDGSVINRSLGY